MEQNEESSSTRKRNHSSSPTEPKTFKNRRPEIGDSKMYALIINVLHNRPGAEHDNVALKKLLLRCNVNITMCTDFSKNGIKKTLTDFKSMLQIKKGNIDGCIVAVMSHGRKDEVFQTSDGKELSLYNDIVDQLNRRNCPFLDYVPKVFLVNVCRGQVEDSGCVGSNDTDTSNNSQRTVCSTDSTQNFPVWFQKIGDDIETDDSISGSSWKDTLICYASYFDCVAYRSANNGTRYIQKFCEIADKNIETRPTNIEEILKLVNEELSIIPNYQRKFGKNVVYQTPCFKNVGYLRNMLFLGTREMGGSQRVTWEGPELNKFIQDSKRKIKYPITHGLMVNAANYSGREEELGKILHYFESGENLVLVYGFGGIGKTELCKKFSNDICLTDDNTSRIWLHGETVDTLSSSVKELADYLGVKNEAKPSTLKYFEYLTQMILENSKKLLVVIDNVDEIYEEVKSVLKTIQNARYSKMFIIVTSRYKAVLGDVKNYINLDVFSQIETRGMLKKSIALSDSDADELGKLVQNFPLALQQAVAYIVQQRAYFRTPNYSVKNYVKEFEHKKKLMLGQKLDEFKHEYQMTTLVVWNVTLYKIKLECKDVEGILEIVAHFKPEDIELGFLELICRRRKLDFDKGFDIINKYCIVKLDANVERKMYSIHRLLQFVLKKENNDSEYARTLFDDMMVVFVLCSYHGTIYLSESLHLQSVCKYANLKWDSHSFIYFHETLSWARRYSVNLEEALLIVLKLNRLDCALECIKLVYPQLIESNPTELSEEMKRKFVEKFFLWCVINGRDDNVTKEMVMNGEYDAHWDYYDKTVNLIEGALKISIKYFGINCKQHFFALNKLVRRVRNENIEKAMKLCEGFGNFHFDSETKFIYFDTISTILEALDKKRTIEIQQVERVKKIVNDFSEIHPKSVKLVGLLEAIIFDFKDDYVKALDLIKQFLPQLEGNHRNLKWWYEKKEDELKIKTMEFYVLTREEIESEFGEVYYGKFSLRGLEKIEKLFEEKLGEIDPLTVRIKVSVANKLWNIDTEKCIKLCEFVLNSPVDTEYETAFRYLCYAQDISRNYDEQKVILEKFLAQKKSLGENHSNLIRIKQLLAKTKEELCDFTGALELFEYVKKYAVDCGWDENDLKESRSDVARLKLKIGDFNDIKTRDDIYREFGEFDDYYELSLEQLQKMLPIYISVLGDSDKLTLELKLGTPRKLHYSNKNNKALVLLEEIINSEGNEDVIKSSYYLMYHIGYDLYKLDNSYVKAKEVLERVLQYQTQTGQDVTRTKKALAEVEKMLNSFKK